MAQAPSSDINPSFSERLYLGGRLLHRAFHCVSRFFSSSNLPRLLLAAAGGEPAACIRRQVVAVAESLQRYDPPRDTGMTRAPFRPHAVPGMQCGPAPIGSPCCLPKLISAWSEGPCRTSWTRTSSTQLNYVRGSQAGSRRPEGSGPEDEHGQVEKWSGCAHHSAMPVKGDR